jgi:hypothetical protein
MPLKMYTTTSAINPYKSETFSLGNWRIIAVSKIPVFEICLSRRVTTCHRQFARGQAPFDDDLEPKLQHAINVGQWDIENRNGKSLASH